MEIFFWLKFVCFDSPVGVASSAAPEEKSSTTNDNFFFKNWIWFYIFQQNLSKKLSRQMLFRIEKGRTFVTNIFTWIFMWVIIMYIHTLYTMIKDYWTTSKKTKLLACPKDSFGTAGGLWQKNVLKCHLASSEENAKVKTKNENQTTKNALHQCCV